MLASGWVSPPTSYFDFLLLMESMTDLASSKQCPPGSLDTHQERRRSRQTGEEESCQGHTDGHWSGSTSSTGGLCQERRGPWWQDCKALETCYAWSLVLGENAQPTSILWYKLARRVGWSTCAGLLADLSLRGS